MVMSWDKALCYSGLNFLTRGMQVGGTETPVVISGMRTLGSLGDLKKILMLIS